MIPTFRTDLACINLNFSLKTEKDARAYAGNQGGAFLPLTSLQNLRKDKIPDETTVTVGIRKDEILQNESKQNNNTERCCQWLPCKRNGCKDRKIYRHDSNALTRIGKRRINWK